MSIWNQKSISLLKAMDVSDGAGGYLTAYTVVSTFSGMISRKSTRDMMLAQQLNTSSAYKLYCDTGVDIAEGDHVSLEGLEYKVIGKPLTPSRGGHLEIELELIQ